MTQRIEIELARQALGRLRQREQEVLRLALWERLTHADMAVVRGVSEATMRKRFSRAKHRIGAEYRSLEQRHSSAPSRPWKEGDR